MATKKTTPANAADAPKRARTRKPLTIIGRIQKIIGIRAKAAKFLAAEEKVVADLDETTRRDVLAQTDVFWKLEQKAAAPPADPPPADTSV